TAIGRRGDGRWDRPGRAVRRADCPPRDGRRPRRRTIAPMSPIRAAGANPALKVRPKARPKPKPKRRKRAKPNPSIAWARRLARYRPGLLEDTLDRLSELYGPQLWQRRLDPTSELILTILTQSTADVNAEQAFVALRAAYPS